MPDEKNSLYGRFDDPQRPHCKTIIKGSFEWPYNMNQRHTAERKAISGANVGIFIGYLAPTWQDL